MTLFAVEYVYDITRTKDLDALRPKHRAYLSELHEQGTVVVSGPWEDAATPGAMLIVKARDHTAALAAIDADPFHRAHLIVRRTARAWNPVIGSLG